MKKKAKKKKVKRWEGLINYCQKSEFRVEIIPFRDGDKASLTLPQDKNPTLYATQWSSQYGPKIPLVFSPPQNPDKNPALPSAGGELFKQMRPHLIMTHPIYHL